jgi:hypothetical protein
MDFAPLGQLGNQFFGSFKQSRAIADDNERRRLTEEAIAKNGGAMPGLGDLAAIAYRTGDTGSALQALAMAEQGGLRDLQRKKLEFEIGQAQNRSTSQQRIDEMLFGGGQSGARPASASEGGDASAAIARIESGGRYDAVGPSTRTGDRAFGKYQVMGANVGPWTEKYVGRRMTPQEFLASPEAQEAVFRGEFGRLQARHGPAGAARAWFAGEGGMNDPNRKDILGTSVANYERKFMSAFNPNAVEPAMPPAMQAAAPVEAAAPMSPGQNFTPRPQMAQAQPAVATDAAPPAINAQARQALPPDDPRPDLDNRTLMGIMGSSGASDRQRDYAKMILDRRNEWAKEQRSGDRPTDLQRNYERAVRQGYQGDIVQYQRDIRPGTSVNVDTKGETKFQETAGKALAERAAKLMEDGDAAVTDKALVGQLRELGGQIKLLGSGAAIQGWLAERGIKVGPNVSEIEAYTALVDKLTPQQRVPGSGATSDFDARMFKSALPSLVRTPEGNRIIVDTLDALADNRLRRAEISGMILNGDIDRKEGFRQLNEVQKQAKSLERVVIDAAKTGGKAPAGSQGGAPSTQAAPGNPPATAPRQRLRFDENGNQIQ